jgi:hypothetical protein
MTIIMSCDHHGRGNAVPEYRSRATILRQFAAAIAFADAFAKLAPDAVLHLTSSSLKSGAPSVEIDLAALQEAWRLFGLWRLVEPTGDALVPPFASGEIRVPPEGGPAEGASSAATGEES